MARATTCDSNCGVYPTYACMIPTILAAIPALPSLIISLFCFLLGSAFVGSSRLRYFYHFRFKRAVNAAYACVPGQVMDYQTQRAMCRSAIWEFFDRGPKGAKSYTCKMCLKTPTATTTTLVNHLKLHPEVFKECAFIHSNIE